MPLLLLVGCRVGLQLSSVVTANFCRLSKSLLETTSEAIPQCQGARLPCKYQSLLKSAPAFVSATIAFLILSWFPAIYIAGLASMQDLVPMRPTVVSPNCFGTTAGTFIIESPAAATS
jgi:hypothetical protein